MNVQTAALPRLSPDIKILFATRVSRLFAYGFLALVLVLYLSSIGLSTLEIGILLSLVMFGDTAISFFISIITDRIGRRKMLVLSSGLMIFASLLFAFTDNFALLLVAATIGIISPHGYEVGPFLSIEQASLAQIVSDKRRTFVFAVYNMVGQFSVALGSLAGGLAVQMLQDIGYSNVVSYKIIIMAYGGMGLVLAVLFMCLSKKVEPDHVEGKLIESGKKEIDRRFGLHKSRSAVFRLSALFMLDAFAGGFILSSIISYWFVITYGVEPKLLGGIFFLANIFAGISSLLAALIAKWIGLIRTMVFTHLPSHVLLILVPLMPNLELAITVLLMRYCISQMDVPARQSYTMALVDPDERTAAAGITGVARTAGAAFAPFFTGILLSYPALLGVPFFIAGGLKSVYDVLLYFKFRGIKPPEEQGK